MVKDDLLHRMNSNCSGFNTIELRCWLEHFSTLKLNKHNVIWLCPNVPCDVSFLYFCRSL